jgi:hypothetical protein
VSLKDLLGEIEVRSGIIIDLRDAGVAAKPYTIEFRNLPAAVAFRTILRDLNSVFFYSGNRLARVLILPTRSPTTTATSGLLNPNYNVQQFPQAENASLKSELAPEILAENTGDRDVTAKLEAIEAIEDSNDPKTITALEEALTDQHRKVKEAALQALAGNRGGSVTEMLRRGLNDSDPEFRIQVLEALADRGDIDSLRKALADPNQQVRETAADLLWNVTTQN